MDSISFWIVVYSPQIYECWLLQSGEGLSVTFLIIVLSVLQWLAGDLSGLVGAVIQNLTITISLLAVYYSLCDILLLAMIFWYRKQRRENPEKYIEYDGRKARIANGEEEEDDLAENGENTPLLEGKKRLPKPNEDAPISEKAAYYYQKNKTQVIAYSFAFVFIVSTGLIAWLTTPPTAEGTLPPQDEEEWNTVGQCIGWLSAALYLGSRIPQIMKNTRTKCQGLSLMMFAFSVMGNLTYMGAVLFPSTNANHVYINFSWLVGSGGTIFLDFVVLGQHAYYWKERSKKAYIAGGESDIVGI